MDSCFGSPHWLWGPNGPQDASNISFVGCGSGKFASYLACTQIINGTGCLIALFLNCFDITGKYFTTTWTGIKISSIKYLIVGPHKKIKGLLGNLNILQVQNTRHYNPLY